MPPKSKKRVLKDEQIQATVNVVKQYWPNYQITTASIKNPTKAFVLKLYTDCMQNLDEKLAFATRTRLLPEPPGLGEEELLFLKLSRIPSLAEADFKLGDLYTFDPIRVNTHIHIIMHFLMFTETIMDKTVQISNTVFDAKEKKEANDKELIELKQDIYQKRIQLTELKEAKKKLQEEAAAICSEYELTVALIEESENKCRDKIEEENRLQNEIEKIKEEVEKLEKTQSNLKNQIISEEEYKSLKSTLESLEIEDKNLEEIDLNNGLIEQKQNIEHLQMCLRELKHLELPEDIFKLSNYREQLKDESESLQYALNQKNNEESINALKTQLENEKRAVETEKMDLQEKLRAITEEGMLKENKLNKMYQQSTRDNQVKIMERQRALEKREADYVRLEKGLKERYDAIVKKQHMALERFRLFINKVNQEKADKNLC